MTARIIVVISITLLFAWTATTQTKWKGQNPNAQVFETDGLITSWQWLNPLPQGNTLYGIHTDSVNAFAVGAVSTVIKGNNLGNNWSVQHYAGGVTSALLGVYFPSNTIGIAVGESGTILRTVNAGTSWTLQASGTTENLHGVYFSNNDTGVVVGSSGTILRTTNGGVSWVNQTSGVNVTLNAIYFSSAPTGTAVGDNGKILQSTDGGITWSAHTSITTDRLSAVHFIDINTGFIVGNDKVLRTTDGGNMWSVQTLGLFGGFSSISFAHGPVGVIVGSLGSPLNPTSIYRTTNAGISWTPVVASSSYVVLNGVSLAQNGSGIAVGQFGAILVTTNGGVTWQIQSSGTTSRLTSLSFGDARRGCTIGFSLEGPISCNGRYKIFRTTDGGSSWLESYYRCAEGLRDISFSTADIVVAVGEQVDQTFGTYRIINVSTNGGTNWIRVYGSPADQGTLFGVAFGPGGVGLAVGGEGKILRTTNAGYGWISQASGTTTGLASASFANANVATIVGGNVILRSTDGGTSWFPQTSGTTAGLGSVFLSGPNSATVVGSGGTVLRTTDGGISWLQRPSGTTTSLNKVSFAGPNLGVIVGDSGTVLRTTDGGENWSRMGVPTLTDLYSVQFVPSGSGYVGYIAGVHGTILVAAVSPLNSRRWTWTGAVDSLWHRAYNWTPPGLPLPGDSVIIQQAMYDPVIDSAQQQITIGSLNILPRARLTITSALPRFVVLGDITVQGTLEIRPPAVTTIVVGGNWHIQTQPDSGRGFLPATSTVFFTGRGTFERNFYNLIVDTGAVMTSTGNLSVDNQGNFLRDANLRPVDTVFFGNADPQALVGKGKIPQGTIQRAIQSGVPGRYRFESDSTYLRFFGSYPTTVALTTYPNLPINYVGTLQPLRSFVDTVTHTIRSDSLLFPLTDKYIIARPPPTTARGVDTLAVRRAYRIIIQGNQSFSATLSLRYERSEVPPGVIEDSLKLFLVDTLLANVANEESGNVETYSLYQNYPNPFNPTTIINYWLPVESWVTIRIYNILGQEINTIVDELQHVGNKTVVWNGKSKAGSQVSSGVYFYRLEAKSAGVNGKHFMQVKKMLLIR